MNIPFTPVSWRSTFELYHAADTESAAIRARHLGAVLRLVPVVALANLVNAGIVAVVFASTAGLTLWLWLAALGLTVGLLVLGRWRWQQRRPTRVSPRMLHRATLHAVLLGAVWGAAPMMWFAQAQGAQQVLLTAIFAGMMAGGAFILVPMPAAALAWVAVLSAASLITLLREAQPVLALTAGLVLTYGATLVLGALEGSRKATALLREQREAERQRQMVAVLLQDFEEHAAEALWETDASGQLSHVSARGAELLGVDPEASRGRPLLDLVAARDANAAALLQQALAAGRPFRALQLEVGEGAQAQWWAVTGKPRFDAAGATAGWRGVIADVSRDMRNQQRLRHLAHHDVLTGLANRLTLHDRLRELLAAGRPGTLLAIDLDHFKAINDSMGHSIGDAVLKVVAVRLSACVRPGDVVARLGGDEFAMLVEGGGRGDDALALARRVVAALHEPCEASGRQLRIGASVGVALVPEHGRSADELFGHADMALYEAKAQGRDRACLYVDRLGERSRRRVDIEHDLRLALSRGELALHWQPQVDIQRWRIVGAEALLRWQHPRLGAVGPSEFVAVAERSGQIQGLGQWVLDQACRAAATQLPGLAVSVNVSPVQLRDPQFAEHVAASLREHRLDASRLELEITESLFIDDAEGAFDRLQQLRRLGVRIALDDFGTGYSSLAYLRRFPFDTLKIDRSFVSELMQRSDAQAIVRSIAQLAHTLGMRTIAEGVETEAQLGVVSQTGCHEAQGFLISEPCTADAFVALRRGWADLAPPTAPALH